MSIEYIFSGAAMTKADFEEYGLRIMNLYLTSQSIPNTTIFPLLDFKDSVHEDDNMIVSYMNIGSLRTWSSLRSVAAQNIGTARVGVKLSPNTGRYCIVRIPIVKYNDPDYGIYQWMIIGTDTTLICDYHGTTSFPLNRIENDYDYSGNYTATTESTDTSLTWQTTDPLTKCSNNTFISNVISYYSMESEYSDKLRELLEHGKDLTSQRGYTVIYPGSSSRYAFGLPNSCSSSYQNYVISIEQIPDFIPVFYLDEGIASIINYLDTGDDSGRKNPFDYTPKIEPITDYKTNFDMYISANNKSNNKYTIVAVNNQYNQNREELQGLYELKASTSIPFDVNTALNPSQAQIPTITYNSNVNSRDEVSFYFGDTGYTENYSGCFQVSLIKDPTSKVNVKINTVYWSDYPGEEGVVVRGNPITDGYEFTASSGERLRIYFRSISLDDIKDITDENYPTKDDEDNDKTGSDVIPLYGSGLRTYILSDGAFDQVNKALWNTDWSTVFKTTTIDPIKCVISCKRIPFTVSGTSADTIYLANRDIAATTAFISPVKKFRIGSYTIHAIYGNFVDITMTKIHVYLPYIGWKELPAPEVMSRVGRAQVGLQSKTYNLTFDYIVDFVDGNVRCIVSVNGTERWYFDGNCAIDVPVTSDNHTAAVSTAIKSGVATVMSVGSTIGGMWSGNALAVGAGMMGTIQNAMNVVPTYEYSATGSPSGYIDATMNKHIMLIIEYPNAFYPSGYSHKVGLPCMLNLSLGSCSGFTRTVNVDTRGINCTADESDMIKNLLNAGVYL